MHEVDMTRCLLLSMQEWKAGHAPALPQVERVHLQVGDFTCVQPEALRFTWAAAVRGTWLAGAELAIDTAPLVARCLPCGVTYSPAPERGYRSPCCDHPMEEIVSGRELRIRSVDYTLPDPVAGRSSAPVSSSPFATTP